MSQVIRLFSKEGAKNVEEMFRLEKSFKQLSVVRKRVLRRREVGGYMTTDAAREEILVIMSDYLLKSELFDYNFYKCCKYVSSIVAKEDISLADTIKSTTLRKNIFIGDDGGNIIMENEKLKRFIRYVDRFFIIFSILPTNLLSDDFSQEDCIVAGSRAYDYIYSRNNSNTYLLMADFFMEMANVLRVSYNEFLKRNLPSEA